MEMVLKEMEAFMEVLEEVQKILMVSMEMELMEL